MKKFPCNIRSRRYNNNYSISVSWVPSIVENNYCNARFPNNIRGDFWLPFFFLFIAVRTITYALYTDISSTIRFRSFFFFYRSIRSNGDRGKKTDTDFTVNHRATNRWITIEITALYALRDNISKTIITRGLKIPGLDKKKTPLFFH